MISISAHFLLDANVSDGKTSARSFFFICDFVSKLGKMSTDEAETSVE